MENWRALAVVLAHLLAGTAHGMGSRPAAVPDSAEAARPMKEGARVPEVTLRTVEGEPFALSAAFADGPAVLMFYRGGWCPYCNRHLAALEGIGGELRALGVGLYGISPDRPEKLAESVEKHSLSYTLLSDSPMDASKAFGLAFRVDDATVEKYRGWGIDLEGDSGRTHHLLPVPAVYVVGADGIVGFSYADPNYKERLAPERVLAAAREAAKVRPAK